MHPRKVSKLLGADDDGDIVGGVAAHTDLDGTTSKVVMLWRFPQVDAPAFMAFPEGFYTPWDGSTEEERDRYRRVIEIFAPTEISGEPPLGDEEVTLVAASEAYRLSGTGARESIDAGPISKDATEKAAWEMIERKRKLNQIGPLTRDLERLGDLVAKVGASVQRARDNGQDVVAGIHEKTYNAVRSEAEKTRLSTELVAIKHKKATEREVERPALQWPSFDYRNSRTVRQRKMPIDYPDDLEKIDTLLKEYSGKESICLEDWEGPRGESRHAVLIRDLIHNPVQEVVQIFERVKVDRQTFLNVTRKKLDAHLARFEEEQLQIERTRIGREADTACIACQFFRQMWHNLRKEEKCYGKKAHDKEAAQKKMKDRRRRVSRELGDFMSQISQALGPMGLAEGIRRDWGEKDSRPDRRWANTTTAGTRLLTGRTGEVFLSQKINTRPLGSEEKYAVIFTSGKQNTIPIDEIGETSKVRSMNTRIEDDERIEEIKLENGEELVAHYSSEYKSSPTDICVAVERGTVTVRITRTTRSQGILRWKS